MSSQVPRIYFTPETADLHRPLTARFNRRRRLQDFEPHLTRPLLYQTDFGGGRLGKIHDPAFDKWASVSNSHYARISAVQTRNPHNRTQWQRTMRRRHGVHVVNFTIRCSPVVIRRPVPARNSSFN